MDEELAEALRQLTKRDLPVFSATVKSVDKEKGVCTISYDAFEDEGLVLDNVRLASVINNKKQKFFLYPKIGSSVLVGSINEDIKQLYIEQYSELDEFRLRIADCDFCIDEAGMNFKRTDKDLRGLILKLIATIRAMKFTTNTGSTITLLNEPDFIELETEFKQLLKVF